jgi:chemotaxis protein MotB
MVLLGGLGAAALAGAGCGMVPQGRLDECHKMSRTLQSENARLKDQALNYRAQNQELSLRAVDDARQIKAQEEAIARLEQSVLAYQGERDELERSFERLKGQVEALKGETRVSGGPPRSPLGLAERLRALARGGPGAEVDEGSSALSVPTERLFEPGSDRLTPEAAAWLRDVSGLLSAPEARDLTLRVVGPADDPSVRRAGLGVDDRSKARFLGMARAARVRDLLATEAGIDRARIALAGPDAAQAAASKAGGRRIEIQTLPRDPAPDGPAAGPAGGPSGP